MNIRKTMLYALPAAFLIWASCGGGKSLSGKQNASDNDTLEALGKGIVEALRQKDKDAYMALSPNAAAFKTLMAERLAGKTEAEIKEEMADYHKHLSKNFDKLLEGMERNGITAKDLRFEAAEKAGTKEELPAGMIPLNVYFSHKGKYGILGVISMKDKVWHMVDIANTYRAFGNLKDELVTDTDRGYYPDSTKVALRLKETLKVFAKGDNSEAAKYIVYRGEDKARRWKSRCDYTQADEKKRVDEILGRINRKMGASSEYHIIGYYYEKESEGVWHVLEIGYERDGRLMGGFFAFLKINGEYALGDVDF